MRFKGLLLAAALLGLMATAARAGTLDIQLSGLNLAYDGTSIIAGAPNTIRTGNIADAGSVISADFLLNGAYVGQLSSGVYADLYMTGIKIPDQSTTAIVTSAGNGGKFGVDLLSTQGYGLALDIDTVEVVYGGHTVKVQGSGTATGINAQNLPFGLKVGQPVTFSFTGTSVTGIEKLNGFVTKFDAAGDATITAPVPLPAAAWASFGMLGLLGIARMRKAWR